MLQLGFRSSRARTIASSSCVAWRCTRRNHFTSLGVKQQEPSALTLTEIFQAEKRKRARELCKLVVKAKEAPDSTYKSFLMNQNVSTAFDVAKHISHHISTSSALCVQKKTDGSSKICSLNEPLHEECDIDFIQFDTPNKEFERHVHEAFFRSSSILLGATAAEAFNQVIGVRKHTAKLNDSYFSIHALMQSSKSSWMASQAELGQLSSFAFEKFISHSIPFEVLQLSLESFKDAKMDMRDFVDESGNVKLCRVGDYVAPIDGPVITHTSQIGRFAVVQAAQKEANLRLCGMSIPRSSRVSSYIWNILLEHSQKKANE